MGFACPSLPPPPTKLKQRASQSRLISSAQASIKKKKKDQEKGLFEFLYTGWSGPGPAWEDLEYRWAATHHSFLAPRGRQQGCRYPAASREDYRATALQEVQPDTSSAANVGRAICLNSKQSFKENGRCLFGKPSTGLSLSHEDPLGKHP